MANLLPSESELDDQHPPGRRFLLQAVPAWLISMLLHVLIIVVLATITIAEPIRVVNVLSANTNTEAGPEIEEFTIEEVDPSEIAESAEITEPTTDVSEAVELEQPAAIEPLELATVTVDIADIAAEIAPPSVSLQTLATVSSAPNRSAR